MITVSKKKNASSDAKTAEKATKLSAGKSLPGTDKRYIRTIRILAFLIPVVAVLIGMLAGSFAPFGGKDVMTSGGMTKHLTYYYELWDRVHGGESLTYSLTSGTGYDFTTVFTYYLSDPLNLIILIFPRTAILAVINILYALKIGLAGLFMSIFLTHRKARIIARKEAMEALRADSIAELAEKKKLKKEAARAKAKEKGVKEHKDFKLGGSEAPKSHFGTVLSLLDLPNLGFSVAFALSAYMIGQGLDVSHLSVVALFPLILMALDNLLENGSWRMYAALMTASVFCSFYMTIIVFIFSILYTAVYDYSDIPHALRNILLKLISDVLAAGAGMMIILNSAGSTFFQEEISIKFPYGGARNSFFDVLKALFPRTAPASTEYYGYGIDIFCGILVVFLVILYVGNPNISLRRRISQSSILVILTTALIFFTPNYIFNGFFYSDTPLSVFGFLFVLQILTMGYEALMNLDHSPVWHVVAALAVLAGFIALTPRFCDGYSTIQPVIYAMEFMAIGAVLILLYRCNSITKRLFLTLLPLVLIIEICWTYVDNLRSVGSHGQKYEETMDSRMYETSRAIHQKAPDARVYFCCKQEDVSTPVLNTLQGYDYILAPKGLAYADSFLESLGTVNDIEIFRNTYSAKAVLASSGVAEWSYNKKYPFSSLNTLLTTVFDAEQVFDNAGGNFGMHESIPYDDDYYEDPRKTEYYCVFTVENEGDLYASLFGLRHFGELHSGDNPGIVHRLTQKEIAEGDTNATFALLNKDSFLSFIERLKAADYQALSNSSFQYHVSASEACYLLTPLQNLNGFSVSVNGSSVSTKPFMDSEMMLIPLQAGDNAIQISFRPILFYWGIGISVIFLLALIYLASKDRIRIAATNRSIHSVGQFFRDNYVYFVTFGIATLVFIIMQMHTSCYPFGNNATLVGDGYVQAYNGYVGTINSIKEGSFSPLNWNIGIAIDRYNSFSAYFTAPWNYLRALIIPESMYLFDLTFSYFLSFATAGIYMILYLTHRHGARMDKRDWRLMVIGTVYGLCSFNISYFIYNNFGFLTMVPLLLLGMEKLVYDKKPFLYIFLLFGRMGDAYYAFMICEFITLYFFTMHFEGIKDFFLKGIRILIASVSTALLSCFRMIPYYLRTLESPYKVADVVSPTARESGSYISLVSDSMSFHEPIVVTDNDYKANIYIGILILLCIPLYMLNKDVKLSIRIRRMLLLAFYFVAFGNSTLNYVLHGFHYQANVPNRFAAFFLILLTVMFYDILISIKNYSRKTIALSFGIMAAVLVPLWFVADSRYYFESSITLTVTLCFTGVYLLLMLLQFIRKHRKTAYRLALCILLLELIMSSFYTFRYLGHDASSEATTEDIQTLADRHPDMTAPFTATEIIGDSADNRAEGTAIRSVSAFSSFLTSDHIKMFNRWSLLSSNNYMYYLGGNPLADMMLHIKYQITNNYVEDSWSHYEIIDETNNLSLHENLYYLPLGVFFRDTQELRSWNDSASATYADQYGPNCFLFQNAFMHSLGYNDLYTIIDPETDPAKLEDESKTEKTYIMADKTEYVEGISNLVPVYVNMAKDVEGDIYVSYNNTIFYLGTAIQGEADEFYFTMQMSDNMTDSYIRLATVNYDELSKLHSQLKQSVMTDIEVRNTTISGKISAPEDGIAYLSLPDMKGWQCYLDGKPVEHISYFNGIGISVPQGDHEIQITYVPNGMWLGIWISVGTAVLMILYAIYRTRKKKRSRIAN